MCTLALKNSPGPKNNRSADKQNFSLDLHVHLALLGKAHPLPSHVMGGGGSAGGKKVFTYLI